HNGCVFADFPSGFATRRETTGFLYQASGGTTSLPPLARQVQIQGTVIVKLTIATDGTVLAAESPDAHPLLKDDTEKLLKKWTCGCAFCSSATPYEKTIKSVYRLAGEEISYDDTRVVMDLPQEVLITASPRERDHCLPKKSSPRGTK